MLPAAIALEREQGAPNSVAAEQFRFSSKLRIPKESKGIPFFPSILFALLGDDVGLFPLLLRDSCLRLYTIFPSYLRLGHLSVGKEEIDECFSFL